MNANSENVILNKRIYLEDINIESINVNGCNGNKESVKIEKYIVNKKSESY